MSAARIPRWFTNPGVSIRGDRETYFAAVGRADRQPFVLPRREINSNWVGISRESKSRANRSRGCDTDWSAAVRIRDGTERETTRGEAATKRARRRRRYRVAVLQREVSRRVVAYRGVAGTHMCNRWKAGIEHLVYFPTSSLAAAGTNFFFIVAESLLSPSVPLPSFKTTRRDSIRSLKNSTCRVKRTEFLILFWVSVVFRSRFVAWFVECFISMFLLTRVYPIIYMRNTLYGKLSRFSSK